jgi:hypothetical protein
LSLLLVQNCWYKSVIAPRAINRRNRKCVRWAINDHQKKRKILQNPNETTHRWSRTRAGSSPPVSLAVVPKRQRPAAASTHIHGLSAPFPSDSFPAGSGHREALVHTRASHDFTAPSARFLPPRTTPHHAAKQWRRVARLDPTTTTTRWIRVFNPSLVRIANCNCNFPSLSLSSLC